ncbi:uncharacterized protein [Branchiostoma lanceolatum]|uniref:uncharacterized protein n=1 Tax=Branchiostoma lanceolatum TaxID=7740 RepID=UPI0034567CF8
MTAFDWMSRRSAFLLLYLGFFLLSTTFGEPTYKIGRQLLTVTPDTSTVPTTGGTTVSSAVGTSPQGTATVSSQQNEGTATSTTGGTLITSHGTLTVNSVKSTLPMTTTKETSSMMAVPTQTMSTPTVTTTGVSSQKFSTLSSSTMASTEEKGSIPATNTTAEMPGTMSAPMVMTNDTINTTVKASPSTACETCSQTISTNIENITASINPSNLTTAPAQGNQTWITDTMFSSSIMTTAGNVTGQGSSPVLSPDKVKGLIMICTTIGFLTILSIVSYSLKVCWWDKRTPKVEKGRQVYEVPPVAPRKVPKRKKSLPRDPRRGGRRNDDLESEEPYQTFDYDKYDHAYIQPVDHHPSGRYVYAYGGSSKSSLGSMPEEPEDVYLELHE